MEGWIKIHHKLLDWEWFKEDGMVKIFLNLLLRASFKDNVCDGINIQRGQLITGRKQLMEETGLTEQTVRTCLKRLQSTGEIMVESTHRYSIITIVNFDVYQIGKNDELTNRIEKTNQPTNQLTNQLKKLVNAIISSSYKGDEETTNQLINQLTNQLISKNQPTEQENVPHTPYKEENTKKKEYKETSNFIKLEEKKVELSFANAKKLLKIRSDKFYESLIPYVTIYGKEMVRAFFDYWSEPNRSQTKMKFELERTWDTKRRLNTWSNRAKIIPRNAVNNSYDIGTANIENSSDKFKNTKKW